MQIDKMNSLLLNFGMNPIKDIKDWKNVKVSTKADLIGKQPKKYSELRITSGSTGKPLYVFYSAEAVKAFLKRTVTSLELSGVSNNDVVLNMFSYGHYIPGSMYERACSLMGVAVLPLGTPNTYPREKIIDVILDLKPTVWLSVPSYALQLLEIVKEADEKALPKKVIVAGERLLNTYIKELNSFGVKIVNHFGTTECPAIGVSKKDVKIIDVIPEGIFIEAVKGENGLELVTTDLNNKAMPIIRYCTKDVINQVNYNNDESIASFELIGRSDDLIKIQSNLISKTELIERLSQFASDFVINITTKENSDCLQLILPKTLKNNENEITKSLNFNKVKIEFSFVDKVEVPKTSSYKLKQVNDLRK